MYKVKGLFVIKKDVFISNEHFLKGLGKYKFKCVKSKEILIMHTFLCAGKKET